LIVVTRPIAPTLALCAGACLSAPAQAQTTALLGTPVPDWLSIHAQDTEIWQFHPAFTSPTRGANSLDPGARGDETSTATLYLGATSGGGLSIYADPEIDQGFDLSDGKGIAAEPNGEGARLSAADPYVRLQRLFARYVIGLGGDAEPIDPGPNQFAEARQPDNLVITFGKFSVVDVFDNNDFAHDPTSDFLNRSIIDAGAFDYASDRWGYTYGASAEWNESATALRAGVFDLSRAPGSTALDRGLGAFEAVAELQEHFNIGTQNGAVALLAFFNRGDMANYSDATRLGLETDTIPDVALVRRYGDRGGFEFNGQQAITGDIGVFARGSIADGHKEAYETSDIDRSLSVGVSLDGTSWTRANDNVGLAFVVNGISKPARDYFAAGGLGVVVGDGSQAKYGPERIVEGYYNIYIRYGVGLTFDNQFIGRPAYNATHGPLDVIGLRFHVAY